MNNKAIEILAKRGEKYDVMEALNLLIKAYIDMCGLSLGCRTVVYCAAEAWQERLAWLDLPLSELARKEAVVTLMPHINSAYNPEDYDDYDISSMRNEELLNMCGQMVRSKEFNEPTLEVLCWGILKTTEEEKELSQEFEVTAPDGTLLKGILIEQKCCHTYVVMTSPYNDLMAGKYELVRHPQDLLLGAYHDYQRLRKMESKVRALYLKYQTEVCKHETKSAWDRLMLFDEIFDDLLKDTVLVAPMRLFKDWFGLIFDGIE